MTYRVFLTSLFVTFSLLGCSRDNVVDPPASNRPTGTLFYNDINASMTRLDLATGNYQVVFTGTHPYATKEGTIICQAGLDLVETSDFITARKIITYVNGSEKHKLDFDDPQVSPDGTLIAYEGLYDDIHIIRRDNGALVASIEPDGVTEAYSRPSWTSDGRVVCAGGFGNKGLYITNTELTTLSRLDNGLTEPKQPHVNQVNNKVVFTMNDHLYTVDIDGSNVTQLTSSNTLEQTYPTWSPDGKWIAFYESYKFLVIPAAGGTPFDIFATYPNAPDNSTSYQFSWKKN
jgi:TolB protein